MTHPSRCSRETTSLSSLCWIPHGTRQPFGATRLGWMGHFQSPSVLPVGRGSTDPGLLGCGVSHGVRHAPMTLWVRQTRGWPQPKPYPVSTQQGLMHLGYLQLSFPAWLTCAMDCHNLTMLHNHIIDPFPLGANPPQNQKT